MAAATQPWPGYQRWAGPLQWKGAVTAEMRRRFDEDGVLLLTDLIGAPEVKVLGDIARQQIGSGAAKSTQVGGSLLEHKFGRRSGRCMLSRSSCQSCPAAKLAL